MNLILPLNSSLLETAVLCVMICVDVIQMSSSGQCDIRKCGAPVFSVTLLPLGCLKALSFK